MKKKLSVRIKALNLKTIIIAMIIVLLVVAGFYAVKYMMKDDGNVAFETLSEEAIPQKIQDIMPRYKEHERALIMEVDKEIYAIAVMGTKPTGGYSVEIDKISQAEKEGSTTVTVYAKFKEPKPGEIVTEVITYPYVVAKTSLKELPNKVELQVEYDD